MVHELVARECSAKIQKRTNVRLYALVSHVYIHIYARIRVCVCERVCRMPAWQVNTVAA